MVVYTVLTTQIELGPAQHYQLVDMFMADPAMFIKYIGVMFETRVGVEDASWLFRGYANATPRCTRASNATPPPTWLWWWEMLLRVE